VSAARSVQERRAAAAGSRTNAEIPDAALDAVVRATPEARQLLGRAVERRGLSPRGARRVMKVARTIADLAGEERTGPEAMAEALSYRGIPGRALTDDGAPQSLRQTRGGSLRAVRNPGTATLASDLKSPES
jgi:predicted ATPase with chaperone activity